VDVVIGRPVHDRPAIDVARNGEGHLSPPFEADLRRALRAVTNRVINGFMVVSFLFSPPNYLGSCQSKGGEESSGGKSST
jgi:hypothetical protein